MKVLEKSEHFRKRLADKDFKMHWLFSILQKQVTNKVRCLK
jgi:hypothetical protein